MNANVRHSIDDLLSHLKTRLAEPGHSLLPLLAVMGRFSKYSLSNQLLIFAQRPDATQVMGYRAWQKAGHQVRKGEHGIAIYAPMRFATRTSDDELDESPSTAPRLGFRIAYVFDVTQVDALPGAAASASVPTPLALAPAGSADAHRAAEQLKALLMGHNVELEYRALEPGLLGYTDGRRITCGTGQPAHVEFSTLVHETTHVLLHFPRDGSLRPDLVTRETEAEAVAYLLSAQLGLDGTEASVDYIRAYRGTPDTLEASLVRIHDTAQRLAGEIAAISFEARPAPG